MGETLWILERSGLYTGSRVFERHQRIKNEFKNRPWTLEEEGMWTPPACAGHTVPGLGNHLPCDGSQWIRKDQ